MKYEIYESENGKRVKFENEIDYFVNIDNEGREYFPVPNQYNDNEPLKLKRRSFSGRIKDAIETIRNGYGDVLSVRNLFGRSESVYRFVDREYGEELRQKTLEGFKDTIFGYSLKFGYSNSFNGSRFIAKDNTILSAFENPNGYVYFDTEQEAECFKNKILTEANRFADKFKIMKINNKGNNDKIQKWFNKNYDNTIFSEIGWAIVNNEDNPEEGKWNLDVVQVIKP